MTEQESGSRQALLNQRRGGKSHKMQDRLLLGFYHMPDCTAKEVAFERYGWVKEEYGNAPKRARDLCGKKLMYLELVGNRECRQSGADAHIYRITERGIEHLKKIGLLSSGSIPTVTMKSVKPIDTRAALAKAKAALA